MSRTKSALKAQRSSERKRQRNARQGALLDRLIRAYKRGEKQDAETFNPVQKALDKAAKTRLIHPAKVNRLKSRLARFASAAKPVVSKPTRKKKTTAKKKK